ncbi:hypothetical protein Tco_1310599 [Tanacetum coccineum]
MLAIFHDMIDESVKVFMDDFSVFGSYFDHFLNNLDKMLQLCEDAHLVLNWEKCHFMVKEGIVLGHKVSEAGLEFEKANIDCGLNGASCWRSDILGVDTDSRRGGRQVAMAMGIGDWYVVLNLIGDASGAGRCRPCGRERERYLERERTREKTKEWFISLEERKRTNTLSILGEGGTGYSLKDKNKAKPDKTESGIGKSAKNQSRRYKRIENGA